jgi:hypothetical protein
MAICRDVIAHFGYLSRATFLQADATQVVLDRQRDLLLSETISSDTTEDFHRIVNHFLPTKKPDAIIIPAGIHASLTYGHQVYERYTASLT